MVARMRLGIRDIERASFRLNLGQWTEMNGVAVFVRRLPDSYTHSQRGVVGMVDVSPHVFGIRDFRKHLKFSTGEIRSLDRIRSGFGLRPKPAFMLQSSFRHARHASRTEQTRAQPPPSKHAGVISDRRCILILVDCKFCAKSASTAARRTFFRNYPDLRLTTVRA